MEGGMRAWQGRQATGDPRPGMARFAPAREVTELAALAWDLEEGSRSFYRAMANHLALKAPESSALFSRLSRAEEGHQQRLLALRDQLLGGKTTAPAVPDRADREAGLIMEGGLEVAAVLAWARGQELTDLLEFAMAQEMNSLDLYLNLVRTSRGEPARTIFRDLANEEQTHLEWLGALLDRHLQP